MRRKQSEFDNRRARLRKRRGDPPGAYATGLAWQPSVVEALPAEYLTDLWFTRCPNSQRINVVNCVHRPEDRTRRSMQVKYLVRSVLALAFATLSMSFGRAADPKTMMDKIVDLEK